MLNGEADLVITPTDSANPSYTGGFREHNVGWFYTDAAGEDAMKVGHVRTQATLYGTDGTVLKIVNSYKVTVLPNGTEPHLYLEHSTCA